MLNDLITATFPQSGGDGIQILATNQVVRVEGATSAALWIPFGSNVFSNAGVDRPQHLLVVEADQPAMNQLNVRIGVINRGVTGAKGNMLAHPPRLQSVSITLILKAGEMNGFVQMPGVSEFPDDHQGEPDFVLSVPALI